MDKTTPIQTEQSVQPHPTRDGAPAPALSRQAAEDFLIHEARLLDDWQLEAWNRLFTDDGIYWIPLDENRPIGTSVSIVHDTPLGREERIFHLTQNSFPAQSPRSRTLHFISNVSVTTGDRDALKAVSGMLENPALTTENPDTQGHHIIVRSNQIVHEMRTGDVRQMGLGEVRSIVMAVEHVLRRTGPGDGTDSLRVVLKKVLLLNRDSWLGNMTFLI